MPLSWNPVALGPEPLEPDDPNDKPPGHTECHGQPPDTMCFSDNRGSSLQPWNFPGPTQNWVLLKADVTKAHRRIKILLQEWRYQVAQLGDEWWVSTVGTYGVASAQLYWGRLAAILLRIVYAVFPEVDWGFVFVDDFAWLLRKSSSPLLATAICLLLLALRTPLSWKKTVLAAS